MSNGPDESHSHDESHSQDAGLKEIVEAVPRLMGALALGGGAAVAGSFLLSNFSRLVDLESQFFGNVLSLFKDDRPPQFMAAHPVLVPILIVVVLIFCVISALTIKQMQTKLITYAVQTYQHITTCNWFASVLGFLKCLIVTIVLVVVTLVQVVVVFVMYIVLLINILAVVIMVFN